MWEPTDNGSSSAGFTRTESASRDDDFTSTLYLHGRPQKFTVPQLEWLESRLTAQDRDELRNMSGSCLREVSWTRGIPTSAASAIILYSLQKFKLVNWSSSQRLMIWGSIPVMSALLADIYFISRHQCSLRIQNYMRDLYVKYSELESAQSGERQHQKTYNRLTYAQIREANRAGHPLPFSGVLKYDASKYGSNIRDNKPMPLAQKNTTIGETEGFMSGTPLAANNDQHRQQKWGEDTLHNTDMISRDG